MKRVLMIVLSVLLLAGCGGRDLSNVKTSLYGHWKNEETGNEYYIGDGTLIQVDEDGEEKKTYKVLEHDEVSNTIRIRDKDEDGSGFETEIVFSNDERETLEYTTFADTYDSGDNAADSDLSSAVEALANNVVAGKTFVQTWTYVDEKQEP